MQMKKPEKGMEVNVFAINNYKDKVMGIMEVKDWRLFLALVLALATHTCAHTHLTKPFPWKSLMLILLGPMVIIRTPICIAYKSY